MNDGEMAVDEQQAFAVYSDADRSLRLYRRAEAPQAGATVDGRAADAVFAAEVFDELLWTDLSDGIETDEVVDDGGAPSSTAHWFSGFENMTCCNLARLDARNVESMHAMFCRCRSLASLDLSAFDTSRVKEMDDLFFGCDRLPTELIWAVCSRSASRLKSSIRPASDSAKG